MSSIATRSLLALAAAVAPLIAQTQEDPLPAGAPQGMTFIEQEGLKKHAHFLASDELGGRYTGTPGQIKAAEYIAKHFEDLGLLPLGGAGKGRFKNKFFQEYPLERTYLDSKGTSVSFGNKKYTTGFAVVAGKGKKRVRVSGRFVYCGTGNPSKMPKSFRRKIPVVVLGSSVGGPRGGMRGNRGRQRASQVTRELARRGAAVAVFLVVDADANLMDAMNVGALLPGKPILLARFSQRGRPRGGSPPPIPQLYLPPEKSKALLALLGWSMEQGTPGQVKKGAKASGKVAIQVKEDKKFRAVNVCAYVKGSSKAQEALVFSAHMDHMGTRMDDDAFNGADDNASGTSGLLEVAEAMAKGEPPKRSVIFLAVSGEELGLWGSEYYSKHPTWPLGKIIADINIDMIGRVTQLSGEKGVSATPSFRHNMFSTLVRDAAGLARKMGLTLTNGDTYYERSDHYNFALKGVPVVFFCDGEHEDYHKVTDHPDKLDYAKMERIARLAYWTGYQAANAKGRPKKLGRQNDWVR